MTQPICPNCKGKQVRYRIRSKSYTCMRCGHEWPKKEEK